MNYPVIVLGAGGHAKVLVDALLASDAVIAGIVDPDPAMAGKKVLGIPVLGGDAVVQEFHPSEILLVNGLGSVGLPFHREQLYNRFKQAGYKFATVVHPSAVIAADVEQGEGVQIMAGAIIQPGCRIGCNVIINTKSSVDHDCIIADHVHIAPGVTLSGGVQIGPMCHIGTGATVIQSLSLGGKSLVAAGSVLITNAAEGSLLMGAPARNIQQ